MTCDRRQGGANTRTHTEIGAWASRKTLSESNEPIVEWNGNQQKTMFPVCGNGAAAKDCCAKHCRAGAVYMAPATRVDACTPKKTWQISQQNTRRRPYHTDNKHNRCCNHKVFLTSNARSCRSDRQHVEWGFLRLPAGKRQRNSVLVRAESLATELRLFPLCHNHTRPPTLRPLNYGGNKNRTEKSSQFFRFEIFVSKE